MTERELQESVLHTAQVMGWLTYHTYDSRRSTPGFPDLVLLRPPRLLFAELKSARGQLSRHQVLWLSLLEAVPAVEVETWTPTDWDSGRVVQVLR